MKNTISFVFLAVLLVLHGCGTSDLSKEDPSDVSPTTLLSFSWEYVKSKRVLHNGRQIQMLEASMLRFEDGKAWPNIIVVKYGDRESSELVYLDLYCAKQNTIASLSESYLWEGISIVPRVYFISHFTLPAVTSDASVKLRSQAGERWITLIGEYKSPKTGKTESYQIPYFLGDDFLITDGLSSFWTEDSQN